MVEDDRTDRHRADGGGAVGRVHLYSGSVRLDRVGPPPRAEPSVAPRYGGGRGSNGVRPRPHGGFGGGGGGGGGGAFGAPALAPPPPAAGPHKPPRGLPPP